jgi:dTDP-4-amino-4,6-dideoxygalactose transaminase
MLVSDDEDAIKKVRFWVTQARDNARHYQHSELGYNYRMSNILAAIGRGQLRALKQRIEQKKHIYETYKENLSCIEDIEFMPIAAYCEPNFWLSVMTLSENSKVRPIDIMMELTGCLHEDPEFMFRQPVLLLCGSDDKLGNIKKIAEPWARGDSNCMLHMIDNAGHNSNQDNPEMVNELICNFLNS